jgi:capsid protein
MDQEEAERLARAIRKAPADWIQVQGVECNSTTGTYELKCLYRQTRKGLFHTQGSWTTLSITSPRQWIDLLTKHRDDLELP